MLLYMNIRNKNGDLITQDFLSGKFDTARVKDKIISLTLILKLV
jgi:hypothetical protein